MAVTGVGVTATAGGVAASCGNILAIEFTVDPGDICASGGSAGAGGATVAPG